MKGIINIIEQKTLIDRVVKQSEVSGIKNQISHLEMPDDNENFESVFYYLEDHILIQIAEWTKILRELHFIKRRLF